MSVETCEPRRLLASDLAVDITDGGAHVETGSEVKYVVTYQNKSSEAAPETQVVVYTPPGTALNAVASTAGWVCEGQVWQPTHR